MHSVKSATPSAKKFRRLASYVGDRTSGYVVELSLDNQHLAALKRMVDFATDSNRLQAQYGNHASHVEISIAVKGPERKPRGKR